MAHLYQLYPQPNGKYLVLNGYNYNVVDFDVSLFSVRKYGREWLSRELYHARKSKDWKKESWDLLTRKAQHKTDLSELLKKL